ncbi:hypothetical protein [Alsobacter sp. R-9]
MPYDKLRVALNLFPERQSLIVRLAERSSEFSALCGDLHDAQVHLSTCTSDEERLEYERLLEELEAELSEWIDVPT